MGFGHVARSRLLAQAATDAGHDVVVVVDGVDPEGAPMVEGRWIAAPLEPTTIRPLLSGHSRPDVVIVDAPEQNVEGLAWLGAGMPAADAPFLVTFRIHGLNPTAKPFEDLVLTPSILLPRVDVGGPDPYTMRTWAGRDLLFVRPTCFLAADERKDMPARVLVTMGGADPLDLTRVACHALAGSAVRPEATVVIGRLNPRGDALEAEFGKRFTVVRQGAVDFDDLLRRSTLAVINGGLTRYECIAAETPFIAVSMHEQQAEFTEAVVRHGFGLHVGVHDDDAGRRLTAAINTLLSDPARIDDMRHVGRGMIESTNATTFVLRVSTWSDEKRRSHRGA
jgi:spore coat polysaccharide biosynthesis predicted glycosyltransferase SpsG